MQTTLEETGKHSVKLTIEVPPEEFAKDLDAAYRKVSRSVSIPGFRKGKAPRKIIDAQVGQDAVLEEFVRDSLYGYYLEAVREHDLAPVADPDIDLDDVDEAKPLKFTAALEVRPRLELDESDYKGLKVEKSATEITDEEIDENLDRLRDRFAELEVVERPATDGDYVVVDLRATLNDEEVEEATRPDALYEVGSGLFTPKLDEELAGKRKGDILKYGDVLPEELGERGGQEVTFTVLVKEVKGKRLPEADDEFAKLASEFDTLDELRADLRTRLEELKEREATQALRDQVLEAMIAKTEVDLPDTLIEHETEHRVENARERAERAGIALEQMLEMQGWDEARFRSDAQNHAIRAVKADLVLEAVARKEEFEVTPEEIATEINALAQLSGQDAKGLAKRLNATGQVTSIASDIIRSKALDLLVEHAEIVPEDSK